MSTRTLDAADGNPIHLVDLGDADAAKTLIIVHGYGEHGGRYLERAQTFVDAGYRVLIPDVRGHGKSGGPRGHVMEYNTYLDDLGRVMEEIAEASTLYLFGHSHGGLIVATWLIERRSRVARAALSSPFFGLGLKPPMWKELAAKVLGGVLPKVSLPSEIDPAHVSHDPAVVEDYKNDPLNHTVANARWYTEAVAAQERALEGAPRIDLPILVLQAGDDRLVAPAASRRWCDAAPELVQYEEIEGAFHELLFEVDGQRHADRVLDWFEAHN